MGAGFNQIVGSGGVTSGNLAGGYNMTAPLTGAGDITNALAALVTSMVAALTGGGTLSADIVGIINAVADLVGSGTVSSASLQALGNLVAALTGSGGASADVSASADMAASIVVTGDVLSTANVASAVWDALASAHNLPATLGQLLNAAGAGGDPWVTTLPGTYTQTQAGGILYVMQQILKNKQKTDPNTGIMTVYADDDTTVLFTANVYNDAGGSTPYDGTSGINLKNKLT